MRALLFMCIFFQMLPALAQPIVDDNFCHLSDLPPALRQTIAIIDGQVVTPENDAPLEANSQWRSFARKFVDSLDLSTDQLVDARERVTIAVANADGSGITVLFSGCVPTFRAEEQSALDAKTGALDQFLGSDWRHKAAANGEKFRREATLAMVQGIKGMPQAPAGSSAAFADGSLVSSLSRSVGYSLDAGLPRLIIYTNLGRYAFPTADTATLRTAGRQDAQRARIDLLRAEVHIFGASGTQGTTPLDYLQSFFLSSKGRLYTLTSATGSLPPAAPPRHVGIYQGTINFPDADYPVRMRLAEDQNGTAVNSWFEVQSAENRYVPFGGLVTCTDPEHCSFAGDNIFAQIWSDNPGPTPQFKTSMPLGGMRNLGFTITGDVVDGLIKDEVGYIVGRESGLKFKLQKIANGIF